LKSGSGEEAAKWHVTALKTALASDDIIAAHEVKKLLELRSRAGLSNKEHSLCVAVIEKNWKALFGDEPMDRSDLMPAVTKIIGKAFA